MNCRFLIWYPAPKSCAPKELAKLKKEGWQPSDDIFERVWNHPTLKRRMTLILKKSRKNKHKDELDEFQEDMQKIIRGIGEFFLVNCNSAKLDEKYELTTQWVSLLYVRPGIFYNAKKSLLDTILVGVPLIVSFYLGLIAKGTPLADIIGKGLSLTAFVRLIATHYMKLTLESERNVYNSIHNLSVKFRKKKHKFKFPTSADITKDLRPKIQRNQVIKALQSLKKKGVVSDVNEDRWKICF